MKRYLASLVIGRCERSPNKTPLYIHQIGKIKISENNIDEVMKQGEHKYTAGGSIIATTTLREFGITEYLMTHQQHS